MKKSVNVPVTTGEIWNIWRDNPELASSVDFIAAHVLPYWENFTDEQAVDQAVYLYRLLREKFPGKRIVIAEFGWPSAGYNLKNAEPGPFEQASVLRNFVTRAEAMGMEYNIVEAIDQPWKLFEGGVGPYWGILDADAGAEILLDRPDRDRELLEAGGDRAAGRHPDVAADSPARPPDLMQALMLSAAANGVGAWAATVFAYWAGHYFVFGSAFALTLGLILLVPLILIAMARIDEIAAVAFGHGPRRLIAKRRAVAPATIGEGCLPESVDPHPRLFRAGRDAEADARCGRRSSTIRTSNASASSTTRPILSSGSRSRITAARSANASSSSTPRRCRASRPARCASPWSAPPPTPRSSASSTPTMSCIRTG